MCSFSTKTVEIDKINIDFDCFLLLLLQLSMIIEHLLIFNEKFQLKFHEVKMEKINKIQTNFILFMIKMMINSTSMG